MPLSVVRYRKEGKIGFLDLRTGESHWRYFQRRGQFLRQWRANAGVYGL